MGTGGTREGILKVKRAGRGKRAKQRVRANIARRRGPRKPPSARALQNVSVRRIKPPFVMTKMKEWAETGRTQMWLWSLRGKEWVIDQELYLGEESQKARAKKAIRAYAARA